MCQPPVSARDEADAPLGRPPAPGVNLTVMS